MMIKNFLLLVTAILCQIPGLIEGQNMTPAEICMPIQEVQPLVLEELLDSIQTLEHEAGTRHPALSPILIDLGVLYTDLGRYQEAENELQRAIMIAQPNPTADNMQYSQRVLPLVFNSLGSLYYVWGRYQEAENELQRALAYYEMAIADGDDPAVLTPTLYNLASMYADLGRYEEAEPLFLRAIETITNTWGAESPRLVSSLHNLASMYADLGRYEEAEPRFQRALEIDETTYGADHPGLIPILNNLANMYADLGQLQKTEPLYLRTIEIAEATYGDDHPELSPVLLNLGKLYVDLDQYEEAEPHYLRAIYIAESLARGHPLRRQARIQFAQALDGAGRYQEARVSTNRAIAEIETGVDVSEDDISIYYTSARLWHNEGSIDFATADLERAISIIESLRPTFVKDDLDRTRFTSRNYPAFDLMTELQLESGNVESAFNWLERGRARVLLDQLAETQGALRSGIPELELEELERREQNARMRQSRHQFQISNEEQFDDDDQQRADLIAVFRDSLRTADLDYRQVYQDIKAASPLWQDILTSKGEPIGLAQVQQELVPEDGLMLLYSIPVHNEGSYVFIVPAEGDPEVLPLKITWEKLDTMIPRGPIRSSHSDALEILHDELFPDSLWNRIANSKEIIIVPDGALNRLPFEALVVSQNSGSPRYWLDHGPPLRYAASATALYNVERRTSRLAQGVLSVSDPIFELDPPAPNVTKIKRDSGKRSMFERAGGSLERLPYTAEETAAIQQAFGSQDVTVLQQINATEFNLRESLEGNHRYLHLATHGTIDERRGSMYASLALTPASEPNPEPDNDGFLELREVYGLDLSSVALAVLSACETNVGEDYIGEGVFSLSRGFLAAGAQRVVATHWQVDDLATSLLIGSMFEEIAQAGEEIDYAQALRIAQQKVRNHPEYADPYFWAAFTLTGSH